MSFDNYLSTNGYLIFKENDTTNIQLSKITYVRQDTQSEFTFTGLSKKNEQFIMPNKSVQEVTIGIDKHQDSDNNLSEFKDFLVNYKQRVDYEEELNILRSKVDILKAERDKLEYALESVEAIRNCPIDKPLTVENCIYIIWRNDYLENTVFYFRLTPDFINTEYFENLFQPGWYSNEFQAKCVDYKGMGINHYCYINANTSPNRFENISQLKYDINETNLAIHEATYKLFRLKMNELSKIILNKELHDDLSDYIFVNNTSNFLSDIVSENK